MNESEGPDTLPNMQANVWPPPPDVPQPEIYSDTRSGLAKSALISVVWSALLFASGFVSFVLELNIHFSPAVVDISNITDRFVWPIVYVAATYFAGRAALRARQANRHDLMILGGLLFVLNLPLACYHLWSSTL